MAVDPEEGEKKDQPIQMAGRAELDLIGLTSPSETVAIYQLAARWAERYAESHDDLRGMLERFRQAYEYLDAVSHGLEPPSE
jgi:hypothetical protein